MDMFGLAYKLELLGLVQEPDRLAPFLSRLYAVALLAASVTVAWKLKNQAPRPAGRERALHVALWMALLNLATLEAPLAPPYTLIGTVWMLTVLAPAGHDLRKTALLFAGSWIALTLMVPEPKWLSLACGLGAQLVNLAINAIALVLLVRRTSEQEAEAAVAASAST